jgi:hypothetical protein
VAAMKRDAVTFLRLLIAPCQNVASEHSWRKCPRCLAIEQIGNRDRFATKLLERAIQIIEREASAEVVSQPPQEEGSKAFRCPVCDSTDIGILYGDGPPEIICDECGHRQFSGPAGIPTAKESAEGSIPSPTDRGKP